MKIVRAILFIFLFFFYNINFSFSNEFDEWLISFNKLALKKGISKETINKTMLKVKFLPKVIEYDRYQPEFYEDTKTYVSKRTSNKKLNKGKLLYQNNNLLIRKIEKKYNIEKELLLSLMGIETNFGTYLGKMDILS